MKAYLSVVANLLFPGLGHYYIGEKGKAVCFAIVVLFTYLIGLSLDLQHYYWYEGVKGGKQVISFDRNAPAHINKTRFVNPQFDDSIHIFSLPQETSNESITLQGHTHPGLTLEVI